jgi:hypothetical protein
MPTQLTSLLANVTRRTNADLGSAYNWVERIDKSFGLLIHAGGYTP